MTNIVLLGLLLTSIVGAGAVGTTMMSDHNMGMMGGRGCPMMDGDEMHAMHEECEEHMEEHCGEMSHEECEEIHEECEEHMNENGDHEDHGCPMMH